MKINCVDVVSAKNIGVAEYSHFENIMHAALFSQYLYYCSFRTASRHIRAKCMNRSYSEGGKKKPHKQKGTGKARQGSLKAPHMRGGAKAHGPSGDLRFLPDMTKKVKSRGLKTAFAYKYIQNADFINIFDSAQYEMENKLFSYKLFKHFIGNGKILFVVDNNVSNDFVRQISNLEMIQIVHVNFLHAHDIMTSSKIFISKDSFARYMEASHA